MAGYRLTELSPEVPMRADICEPSDAAALVAFRQALRLLGAEARRDFDSSLGVGVVEVRIGSETLLVFRDSWSVDIEGPEELVQRVLNAIAKR